MKIILPILIGCTIVSCRSNAQNGLQSTSNLNEINSYLAKTNALKNNSVSFFEDEKPEKSSSKKQNDIRLHFGIGILALSNDSAVIFAKGENFNAKTKASVLFQAGLAATFGGRFFIQPGFTSQAVNIQKTFIETTPVVGTTAKEYLDEVTLKMITVPLKVGFKLREADKKINLRIFGGIDGQFVTNVSEKKTSGLVTPLKKSDFNSMITYADLGMGVDVFFLFVDAGYRIGLAPVMSGSNSSKANMFYSNMGVKIRF